MKSIEVQKLEDTPSISMAADLTLDIWWQGDISSRKNEY